MHVTVKYGYEYTAKDGRRVCIRPGESYILLSKTNQHWWHVRRDLQSRPLYVPAQYMKEPSAPADAEPDHTADVKPPESAAPQKRCLSTFGSCENTASARRSSSFAHSLDVSKAHVTTRSSSFSAREDVLQLYAKPNLHPKVKQLQPEASWQDETEEQLGAGGDLEDMDFPPPPPDIFDIIPEISVTQSEWESAVPLESAEPLTCRRRSLNPTSEAASAETSSYDQVLAPDDLKHELEGIFQPHTFMTTVINWSPDVEIMHFNT